MKSSFFAKIYIYFLQLLVVLTDKVLTVSTERSLISYASLVFIPVLAATRFQVKDAMNVRGHRTTRRFVVSLNSISTDTAQNYHFINTLRTLSITLFQYLARKAPINQLFFVVHHQL